LDWLTTSTILDGLRDHSNAAAWSRLSERFRAPIVRFARRMGLPEPDAEDVAQETLTEFATGFQKGRFDPQRGRLSRWLFGIAYRQALNERRSFARRMARSPRIAAESTLIAGIPDEEAASVSWDHEWEQALLTQCLEQVAAEVEPVTYQAFCLAVGQERPASEVAEQLGVPVKAVYNAKHRVLKRLRELREALEEEQPGEPDANRPR
jgi:RNA polymerase sigma-70 factor (ECF subfamily)